MRGSWQQLLLTLRLHFRNRMGLLYGYLFPVVFLAAFAVLYRHDDVPLARHMGELLTVTILGGACFGLPTTLVSERERGVWRRFRLAPVSIGGLVASTMVARYVILVTAGLLQVGLAMAIGMPLPRHPFELWMAFTFAAFAFLGVGLVIASMADNVPAVQALGQCIFLPMLIIGGVAVPLYVLPDWAQHVSAFFPGRYAVQAVQATVTGAGLGTAGFSLAALAVIGAAAALAGAMMFRWDAEQRFASIGGKPWLAVAVAAWVMVGVLAERTGRVESRAAAVQSSVPAAPSEPPRVEPSEPPPASPVLTPQERAATADRGRVKPGPDGRQTGVKPRSEQGQTAAKRPEPRRPEEKATAGRPTSPESTAASAPPAVTPAPPAVAPAAPAASALWRSVTIDDVNKPTTFAGLPPDEGVVTPMSPPDEDPDPLVAKELERLRDRLIEWEPGLVDDPVQRVRNYLYVAVVPDMFQIPIERYVPWIVLDRLQEEFIREDLIKLLYWVGRRPYEGDESAIDHLRPLGLQNGPDDVDELRRRTSIYARKLLRRVLES